MKPRDYQQQALDARAAAQADRPDENRQAVVMATGLGKGNLIAWEAAAEPGRTLILAHTDEIVTQLRRRVELLAPERSVGTVMAGQDETDREITVASVQTLARPERREPIGWLDRVIVDECHHAPAASYVAVLRWAGAYGGGNYIGPRFGIGGGRVPTTGYTATLERGDGQSLGKVWHDVAFSRGVSWAVRRGHLKPPRGYRVQIPGLTKGQDDQAQDVALVDDIAPAAIVAEWLARARGRSTIVFAPLVRSARAMCLAFNEAGIPAAVIWGEQDRQDRTDRIAAYQRGEIMVLCNANALTEGFDAPRTSCVVMPPTKSRGRVVQRAGRGLRYDPLSDTPREEQDCLLLFLGDGEDNLNSVADLSDASGLAPAADGQTLTALEDEYNLNDLEPDAPNAYGGPLELVQFDPLVAASSKVWGKTRGGALFVPAGRDDYVAILPGYSVAVVGRRGGGRITHRRVPDLETAMALAEDAALEAGGDLGRLLADKGRAWRKGVPTDAQKDRARQLGLGKDVDRIMGQRASGKAGKVSDLIDKVTASRVIDPVVMRMKAGRT